MEVFRGQDTGDRGQKRRGERLQGTEYRGQGETRGMGKGYRGQGSGVRETERAAKSPMGKDHGE